MAATWVGNTNGHANAVTKEYPVANGVTVADGDFVYLTSGRVTSASIAGVRLLGVVAGKRSDRLDDHSETMTATGDAAGTVKVLVISERHAKYVVDNDNVGTTFGASHVGQYFDLTGATGAQLVDTSTVGASGQLKCVEYGYGGDNTLGVFTIAEHVDSI